MRTVGIDIGTFSVKVVEVQSGTRGPVVTQALEKSLSPIAHHDSTLEIIEFLQSLSAQYPAESTRFVLGLSQEVVSTQRKVFPFLDRNKILASLPFELEDEVPLDADDAVFDARSTRTTSSETEVLAVAVAKSTLRSILQRWKDSRVSFSLICPEAFAFANCWTDWNQSPPVVQEVLVPVDQRGEGADKANLTSQRDFSLKVQIGHAHTLLIFLENRQCVSVRSIAWGARNLAEAISREYEMDPVQALRETQEKAFLLPNKEGASYDQVVFSDLLLSEVKNLAREIRLSTIQVESELGGRVLGADLYGGGSRVVNLPLALTQLLEVPVNLGDSLEGMATHGFEITPQTRAVMAPALGLALEGLRRNRQPPIQFLRGEFQVRDAKWAKVWSRWGGLVQLATASLVAFAVFAMLREGQTTRLAESANESLRAKAQSVAGLAPREANERGVTRFLSQKRAEAKGQEALRQVQGMVPALEVLRRISDIAPSRSQARIELTQFSLKKDNLRMEGWAESTKAVRDLKSSLSSLAKGGKISETNASAGLGTIPRAGAIRFAFTLQVERKEMIK